MSNEKLIKHSFIWAVAVFAIVGAIAIASDLRRSTQQTMNSASANVNRR